MQKRGGWKRNEFTTKLLECLVDKTLTARALLLAFLKAGHSGSFLRKELGKELRKELKRSERDYYDFLNKQRFYNLVSKLKREGFIKNNDDGYCLTQTGKEKLKKLISKILPKRAYKKEKDDQIKIITYDILEKERHKRDWLRSTLKDLNFYMLQGSVWIGKSKLPIEFLEDLKRIEILESVHIFTVSQEGTLHRYPINLD